MKQRQDTEQAVHSLCLSAITAPTESKSGLTGDASLACPVNPVGISLLSVALTRDDTVTDLKE